MTVTLNTVTKKLLNDFYKSQPALNLPGKPAAVSGIALGTIIEAALNHPGSAIDAATTKLLNDYSKSQPALNIVGKPAAISGIKLGDLINKALTETQGYLVTVTSSSHLLTSGAVTVANGNANINGVQQVSVVDANTLSFKVAATPSASGTLDYSLGAIGVSYTTSGTGPYTATVVSPGHGLADGALVDIANSGNSDLDGAQIIVLVDENTFTIDVTTTDPFGTTLDWSVSVTGVAFVGSAIIDSAITKQLNLFPTTQPALQKPGVPAASSSIKLGDLIAQALVI